MNTSYDIARLAHRAGYGICQSLDTRHLRLTTGLVNTIWQQVYTKPMTQAQVKVYSKIAERIARFNRMQTTFPVEWYKAQLCCITLTPNQKRIVEKWQRENS